MATITIENYLKALYTLNQVSSEISLTDLSKEMNVSAPTVNNMIKKLQDKGWVAYQKYKPIKLTTDGALQAATIIRKHRLTEMFLVKIMGFGWEEVHDIAEQIEHIKSDDFFDRMDELLGFPKTDPHGSPIPDKNGKILEQHYKTLAQIEPNIKVTIVALKNSSFELLDYLNNKKIKLGDTIQILSIEPFDKSCSILLEETVRMTMTQQVCSSLLVVQ
ncbi:MAG: metal-dependent transcriptional regulator [Crocinitomicaceae bacterium]|jgi:DtxR family Mn-dependent transcriptional regulator|nr:metal-dependent transcriptional regulator [Crocinitomicaceae bacterium]